MLVAILHQAVTPDSPPDDQDVLVQVENVGRALSGLGHQSAAIP